MKSYEFCTLLQFPPAGNVDRVVRIPKKFANTQKPLKVHAYWWHKQTTLFQDIVYQDSGRFVSPETEGGVELY